MFIAISSSGAATKNDRSLERKATFHPFCSNVRPFGDSQTIVCGPVAQYVRSYFVVTSYFFQHSDSPLPIANASPKREIDRNHLVAFGALDFYCPRGRRNLVHNAPTAYRALHYNMERHQSSPSFSTSTMAWGLRRYSVFRSPRRFRRMAKACLEAPRYSAISQKHWYSLGR